MLVAVFGLAGLGTTWAQASTSDVIADFSFEGVIDGQIDADPEIDVVHSISDLQRANSLMAVQQPSNLGNFRAQTKVLIENELFGIDPPRAPATPTAPSAVPQVGIPTWAILAVVGAGLLALGGVGASIYRRARRRVA
jgi:hypothetical protein